MWHAQRIDFFIISKCTNKCAFCSESYRMDGHEIGLGKVKEVLSAEKEKGTELVQFTGGEPTIHSKFPETLEFAKQIGYRTFIITNGAMLSSEAYCKEVLPYLDEIMFSVHGPNEKIHDSITNNKGSFKKLMLGIENTRKYHKGAIKATTCATNLNLPYLKEIAVLIDKLQIKDYQLMTLVPGGRGRENFYKLMPKLLVLKDKIREVIDFCNKHSIQVRFSGVPMCILGNNYDLSYDLYEAMKIDNEERHDGDMELWREPGKYDDREFKIDIGRIKTGKCKNCSKKDVCGGIYQMYFTRYGDTELKPFA